MGQGPEITTLISDVYVLCSPYFQSKRTLILSTEGSVLVDTPLSFRETDMLLAVARDRSLPVRRIVLTHSHFDHSAGCQELPQAERIAQKGAGEWMLSQHAADYLARQPPPHPDVPKIRITVPTLELDGPATLYLDRRVLHLIPTPGHSPDSMSVLMESDGVLFTGDGLVTCFPPVIQDGDSAEAVESYKLMLSLEFRYLVPGHGPVLPEKKAREHCRTSLDYLLEMRSRLASLNADTPLNELVASVEDLPSMFPFPADVSAGWHEHAMLKVWRELGHSAGNVGGA